MKHPMFDSVKTSNKSVMGRTGTLLVLLGLLPGWAEAASCLGWLSWPKMAACSWVEWAVRTPATSAGVSVRRGEGGSTMVQGGGEYGYVHRCY